MALADPTLAAFVGIALLVTISPGPDTLLVIRNTLSLGRRGGGYSILGIVVGGIVQASAAAFGLSQILLQSSHVYAAVKLAGGLYLVYLGLQSLRSGLNKAHVTEELRTELRDKPVRCLREGFLTNALNPKVALFYVAFLPQFIRPNDDILAKTFLLVGIHYTLGFLWLSIVCFAVSRSAAVIQRPNFKRTVEVLAGAIFVGLGARLALDRR